MEAIADAINRLADAVGFLGFILILFLIFKDMGGKNRVK